MGGEGVEDNGGVLMFLLLAICRGPPVWFPLSFPPSALRDGDADLEMSISSKLQASCGGGNFQRHDSGFCVIGDSYDT